MGLLGPTFAFGTLLTVCSINLVKNSISKSLFEGFEISRLLLDHFIKSVILVHVHLLPKRLITLFNKYHLRFRFLYLLSKNLLELLDPELFNPHDLVAHFRRLPFNFFKLLNLSIQLGFKLIYQFGVLTLLLLDNNRLLLFVLQVNEPTQ